MAPKAKDFSRGGRQSSWTDARRAEAAAIKSGPYWIQRLRRTQHLVNQNFAYVEEQGGLTDNHIERLPMNEVRDLLSSDNTHLARVV